MYNPLQVLMNTALWRGVLADVWLGIRHVSRDTLALLGLTILLGGGFLLGHAELRTRFETQAFGWLAERVHARSMLGTMQAMNDDDAQDAAAIAAELAEPDAIERATAADPTSLNRQQAAVVQWISRRYAVAQEPVSRLAQEAWSVGKKVGIDPTLILAVMAIESRYNPFAQSHVGAQGLMQVMTKIHQDKYENFGGKRAAFDPVTNLRVGVQVLKDCITAGGSVAMGLKYYVGAANLAHDSGYGAKVLAEQAYLKQVMAGKTVAITATWPKFNDTEVAQAVNPETQAIAIQAVQPAGDGPEAVAAPQDEQPAIVAPVALQEKPPSHGGMSPQPSENISKAPSFTHDGAQLAMVNLRQ